MEPFKITCVSCRAVLTVRKESMIGQIIACPRCGMMVQVAPPAGHEPASEKSTPSPAPRHSRETKAAAASAAAAALFEDHDALADLTPPPPPAPHVDAIVAATFDEAAEAFEDVASTQPASAPTEAANDIPQPPTSPPVPPAAAATPGGSPWAAVKFPAMIACGAIAGAALVATTLTLLSGDTPPVADGVQVSEAPAASNAASQSAEVAPLEQPTVALKPTTPESHDAKSDVIPEELAAEGRDVELPIENPFADATATEELAPTIDATAQTDAPIDASSVHDETTEGDAPPADVVVDGAAAEPAPKLRIDPLEIDPEGLNLSTLYNGPPQDPLAASQLPAEGDSAELSVPEAEEPPADDAPAIARAAGPESVRRDEQFAGAPGAALPALLARKTPELKVTRMPLCRLLDLSVQLSGVPISVAPEQLRMAAVSAGQPATADVENATIEEFLIAALKPLRLKPVVVADQIVLIRNSDNPRRTVTYEVDDLAADGAAAEELAALVQRAIAPVSWEAAGGTGTISAQGRTLVVETGEAIQYEILVLMERARAALDKPLRSKYPAALIGDQAAPVALAELMKGPATFTFSRYVPLREILRFWQEEMGVAVLVDWPALADLRLWPNSKISCSAAGKAWNEAIDDVLQPLGLAWRPVDKRTIEITSLEKANSAPLLEVYRLDPQRMAESSDLVGQLDQVAAAASPATAGMTNELLVGHGLLIARQPAIAQRALAQWLADNNWLGGQ